ncbi:c-type cytochrome biogenesis protein CcsB [Salisediminibacterium selenitireducens]|uniref:Cytochrome c-type biogenesis protein CcsB n=1 Tax=Bacillus selenitireducens (strain ATCC 700615 / DSM 15326 / MLS10) TaxID=439292 RepID=D6XVE2_BACIE|nr:c-type cytochrome biogenesis protein CcsB [Salisediminibacterium selenitireducens]ADH99680.1 cytochrome c-type biogenesis protein CcsB [[Bacillus] selenitireducens MLS10]
MAQLSTNLIFGAFFFYFASTLFFSVAITGRKFRDRSGAEANKSGFFGYITAVIAVALSLGYFFTRWYVAGFAPVSNMFEYTTALGIAVALAFVIIHPIYKNNYLGLFTMPVVMLIIAYASMFPTEVQPLIPALQSNWLAIHVITTVIGQGILGVSFVAGLIYLLASIDFSRSSKSRTGIEIVQYSVLSTLVYVILSMGFNLADYQAEFSYINENGVEAEITYSFPPIIGPNEGELISDQGMNPLVSAPAIIESADLNTVLWSMTTGLIIYWLIRLVFKKPTGAIVQPLLKKINLNTLDEISYRAVAIGFPVFTLGALIFAMIWAQIAWTRFWGWDPKEVWALITFLFYAAYLHLRLSRGWHGEKSAWLVVIGFIIIMFNLIFVNLVIAGLHSYAA